MRRHMSGGEATYMAVERDERRALKIEPLPADSTSSISQATTSRKAPPRVRKPQPNNDRRVAPTPDLEAHRAELRQAYLLHHCHFSSLGALVNH